MYIDKYDISLDYRLRRAESYNEAYEISKDLDYLIQQYNNFGYFKKKKFNKLYQKNIYNQKYKCMSEILEAYNCAYEKLK